MFKWIAESDDGSFHDESSRTFATQRECYEDMLIAATRKMRWNIDYDDVTSDDETYEEDGIIKTTGEMKKAPFDLPDVDNWAIVYRLECHPHMIQHLSYSGLYTYRIIREDS